MQWLDRCFKMMRVLFLIPVRGGANACGRRSRYHVGINFNTRERVGQMHVVIGSEVMGY